MEHKPLAFSEHQFFFMDKINEHHFQKLVEGCFNAWLFFFNYLLEILKQVKTNLLLNLHHFHPIDFYKNVIFSLPF
jgi:hypothetical protein